MMNWPKFMEGLTVSQFNNIAENWYSRLNNLKEAYQSNPTPQGLKLIKEMIERMMVISKFYVKINAPKPPRNVNKGGIAIYQ